jgi:hypothetical protein
MKSHIAHILIIVFSIITEKAIALEKGEDLFQDIDTVTVSSVYDSLAPYDSIGNHISGTVGIGIGAGLRGGIEVPISNTNFIQFGVGLYFANLMGGEYPPTGLEALHISASFVNNQLHLFDRTSLLLTLGSTYVQGLRTPGTLLYFLTGTGIQIGNSSDPHFQLGLGVGYHWMVVQGDREGDDGFFPNVDFLFVF